MARYHRYHRPPARRTSVFGIVCYTLIGILIVMAGTIAAVRLMEAWPTVAFAPAAQSTAPAGAIGGQAPPSVRGSYADAPAATLIPGIAQSQEESQRMYEATAQAARTAPETAPAVWSTAIAAPLPLNSAGQPIIDETQQQQLDQSAQMAADEQQAAIRAAQLADAAARAPDVSYTDAAAMLHRDPCHVPRADPATCDRGLFKPTPIGGQP